MLLMMNAQPASTFVLLSSRLRYLARDDVIAFLAKFTRGRNILVEINISIWGPHQ